jgi:hypothetical protein
MVARLVLSLPKIVERLLRKCAHVDVLILAIVIEVVVIPLALVLATATMVIVVAAMTMDAATMDVTMIDMITDIWLVFISNSSFDHFHHLPLIQSSGSSWKISQPRSPWKPC